MSEVVVVATLRAAEGNEDEVLAGLSELAAATHTEEGCIAYTLHRGLDDPGRIVMIERWRSRADLDAHFAQPYVAAAGDRAHLLAEAPQVHFLAPAPAGHAEKGRL
jgi:quinol monooxygenase YgiN